jgi:molybdate transport system substrate-binding protein
MYLRMTTSPCASHLAGYVQVALALAPMAAASACGTSHQETRRLTLLAAGASQDAVMDEIGVFEQQTGIQVTATFGSAGALRDQILGGAAVDVAIVTPAVITALDAQQLVLDGSRIDLGRVGGGLAVRAGMALPAIATQDELAQALLAADEVYYADPTLATAGAALMKIVDTLGIGDQVRAKGHVAAGGKEAMQNMAVSTAPVVLGATQISEILSVPQVTLVGEYPGALQVKTVYSTLIVRTSTHPADAKQLTQFFAGPTFQTRLGKSGFEPIPSARQ